MIKAPRSVISYISSGEDKLRLIHPFSESFVA
jgi:hypothetical protein